MKCEAFQRQMMCNKMTKAKSKKSNALEDENYAFFTYSLPLILACLCYLNGYAGDFVHDDVFAIKNNKDVTGETFILDLFKNDFWGRRMNDSNSHKSYRPLTTLSFRLDFHLSGGDPQWFHLVNIVLHLCVTCLLTRVCLRVLRCCQMSTLMSVCLFAVHPVHVEAVTGIVGRADLLAALVFLLAFSLYASCVRPPDSPGRDINDNCLVTDAPGLTPAWPQTGILVTSLGLSMVATLCKETGASVLGVCLIYDVIAHRRQILVAFKKGTLSANLFPCLTRCFSLCLTAGALVLFRLWMNNFESPNFLEEDNPASFSPSFVTRALTLTYLLPFNLWLLLCPAHLSYDWQGGSIPLLESVTDSRNLVTLTFCVGAVCLARKCWRDLWEHCEEDEDETCQNGGGCSVTVPLATCLLVIPFIPASNLFVRVGFVVAERILYTPSLGFCVLVGVGVVRLCGRYPQVKPHLLTGFMLLLLALGARTCTRNPVWQSRRSLFWSGLRTLPLNAKVHYNCANYLKDSGNVSVAIEHYRMAIKLNPHHASYYNNLGTILSNKTEAELLFLQALKLRPDHKLAMVNLGNLYLEQEDQRGMSFLQQALDRDPDYVEALLSLGKAMLDSGQYRQAGDYIRRVLTLKPDLPEAHTYYGALHHKTGEFEKAVSEYQTAFTLNTHSTLAMKNAAVSLRRLKRYPEAEQLLKQALSVHGDSSDYYNQLGLLYAEMGQTLDSLFAFRRSLALAPNNTLTHLRYLKALSEARQHEEVSRGLRDLLQRASNDVDVLRFAFVHAQQRDDLDGALHYAQEAVAQAEFLRHPDLAAFYHDLANIYRQKQDMEKAMEIFLLSVEQDPSYSQAYINIGALHHLQQNFEEAERYYLKALSLEPDNELCAANLQKLRKVWKKSSDSLAKT